ncbi:hypothetical protein JEM67_12405 [Serratia sp. PAMC26656]|uniref:hypothetical protein n=1 Tax=Serratia sp. PAMC26656 TaxID=2775909 RepID=UPI0018F68348|nr:hypothetical protein [Serratia sp. PAMC26656]MBJ7893788.1 hypothetical protein [Serratia sp. PAMC26656]
MQLYRLLNRIMGFRLTGGKGAGKKNVIMRAALAIDCRGRGNNEPQVFKMKRYFNFYEKAGFIFSDGIFSILALCSSKSIQLLWPLKLKFKKYLIC